MSDDLAQRLARVREARRARTATRPLGSGAPAVDAHTSTPSSSPDGALRSGAGGAPSAVIRRRGPGLDVCHSCGAPLRWGTLRPSGARLPLDREVVVVVPYAALAERGIEAAPHWRSEPILYRTVYVPVFRRSRWGGGRWVEDRQTAPIAGVRVPDDELVELPRVRGYRPHVSICPYAHEWRAHRGHNGRVCVVTGRPP